MLLWARRVTAGTCVSSCVQPHSTSLLSTATTSSTPHPAYDFTS